MQEAAASMAEAGIVVKKFPRSHPIMMNAVGMTVGAIMLSVASLLSGEAWTIPTLASTWLAFGYIVVFVTVIAFFLYLFVLGRWTASGTSYGFVLIPLITVVLATTLAGKTKVVWLFSFP
jgi:drug/metabolite transporter (DMT)-like permease